MFKSDYVNMTNDTSLGCEVEWDDTGFTTATSIFSTDMGNGLHRPYLDVFLEGNAYIRVDLNDDGTLTLTRGAMVVVAERT